MKIPENKPPSPTPPNADAGKTSPDASPPAAPPKGQRELDADVARAAQSREQALSRDAAKLLGMSPTSAAPAGQTTPVESSSPTSVQESSAQLAELHSHHEGMHAAALKVGVLFESLSAKAGEIAHLAETGASQSQLMNATQEMQEMNRSFSLQYLALQQDMQSQNRQFTLLSNIMKTKHDTAKNAINNIR